MKASTAKKAIMMFFTLAFISVMGFSQTDDRKKQAEQASLSLTESMTDVLKLTEGQVDSVAQFNLTYTLGIFTTDPLTDDAISTFEANLDSSLKKVLDEGQYSLWTKNKKEWLDSAKSALPTKEKEEDIEYMKEDLDNQIMDESDGFDIF